MPPNDADPVELQALVLPAFDGQGDDPCEVRRWREGYDLDETLSIPGTDDPLRYTEDGIGVLATGMGKAHAAATTAILCESGRVDLDDAYVLSVGIAGVSPEVGTLGSVFLADAVVDWDHKYRLDPTEAPATGLLPYRRRDPVYRLNDDLVGRAVRAVRDRPLADDARLDSIRERYDHEAARSSPGVGVGTTVSSDEYWHGTALAERVQWFLDEYEAGTLCTSQMEDYGTATALARFGYLDRYLSVRAGVNFDRPPGDRSSRESFDDAEGSVELAVGLEDAFRAGSAIVEHLVEPGA